ncbi:pectin lyase fold/virulence factor [Gongronella butleri]|nr:pectin lyase fold/virulence factor [Gongronella butleri]
MKISGLLASFVFASASLVHGGVIKQGDALKYASCQKPKAASKNPTIGCPHGTVYVSASHPKAHYRTVQSAIAGVAGKREATILIGSGTYHEVINVTTSGALTMLGETVQPGNWSANLVTIWNSSAIPMLPAGADDADTVTFTVAPNRPAALIGAGFYGAPIVNDTFGSPDFKAYNLNVENRYANYSAGQALALDVSYANASFYGCAFRSYQDTVYVGRAGAAYFTGCEIAGQTDFIFGFGTAWFENSTIAMRGCGGGVTAWKGSPDGYNGIYNNTFGAYFHDSQLIKSPDANATLNIVGKCALGRPWNNLSRVVFDDCYMDESIQPNGFIPWSGGAQLNNSGIYYAEFGSYGPGFNKSARESSEILGTAEEGANLWNLHSVFKGIPKWIDFKWTSAV